MYTKGAIIESLTMTLVCRLRSLWRKVGLKRGSKKKGKRLVFFARVYLVGCESSRGSRVEKERGGDGKEHSLTNKLSLRSDLSSKATQAIMCHSRDESKRVVPML